MTKALHMKHQAFWVPLVRGSSALEFKVGNYDELVSSPRPDRPIVLLVVDDLVMAVQEWKDGEFWGIPFTPAPADDASFYHPATGYPPRSTDETVQALHGTAEPSTTPAGAPVAQEPSRPVAAPQEAAEVHHPGGVVDVHEGPNAAAVAADEARRARNPFFGDTSRW